MRPSIPAPTTDGVGSLVSACSSVQAETTVSACASDWAETSVSVSAPAQAGTSVLVCATAQAGTPLVVCSPARATRSDPVTSLEQNLTCPRDSAGSQVENSPLTPVNTLDLTSPSKSKILTKPGDLDQADEDMLPSLEETSVVVKENPAGKDANLGVKPKAPSKSNPKPQNTGRVLKISSKNSKTFEKKIKRKDDLGKHRVSSQPK